MKNIPNTLSISRIALAVVLLLITLHGGILPAHYGYVSWLPSGIHASWVNYAACLVFCVASLTDFFDGYIAREYRCGSAFGEVFDPLADKMLILSGFLALLLLDRANAWAIFLILSREFFITGLRVMVASRRQSVKASLAGKYKTGAQIAAIAFLLADLPSDFLAAFGTAFNALNFALFGAALLWLAVLLTLYSGLEYTLGYYKFLRGA